MSQDSCSKPSLTDAGRRPVQALKGRTFNACLVEFFERLPAQRQAAQRQAAQRQAAQRQTNRTSPSLPPHYQVIRELGGMAYGKNYLCEDVRDNSKVAIKWVRDYAQEPSLGKRIYREIRVLAALDHENLLSLVGLFQGPRTPPFSDVYIVIPYMQMDLHKVIHSLKLSEKHAIGFSVQILRGLKYLHSAGIVHRDLNPANILVNKDCTLRIADMGLARGHLSKEEEELTEYVVTRRYRAPELWLMPNGYFEAVDLWSVGCIHAEVLSSKPLFYGDNKVDMLKSICGTMCFDSKRDLAWLPAAASEAKEQAFILVEHLGLDKVGAAPDVCKLKDRLPGASPETLEFVNDLLKFDPTKRISAADALVHPYLAYFSNKGAETTAAECFAWDFDDFEATPSALQERVAEECRHWQPEDLAPKPAAPELAPGGASSRSSTAATAPAPATQPPRPPRPPRAPTTPSERGSSYRARSRGPGQALAGQGTALAAAAAAAAADASAATSAVRMPEVWITRWYRQKRSLAYMLSDGFAGVYYEDFTKIGLRPDRRRLDYFDDCGTHTTYTVENFPLRLSKQVALLRYFIDAVEKRYSSGESSLPAPQLQAVGASRPAAATVEPQEVTYVKKWERRPKGFMFQLSNKMVQMFFVDKTEVFLSSREHFMTYVDTRGQIASYPLNNSSLEVPREGLRWRLHYAKEFLAAVEEEELR